MNEARETGHGSACIPPDTYHGHLEDDQATWPRRISRRFLGTGERPRALFDLVRTLPDKPRILDVGCGTGRMLEAIGAVRPDAELHAVDVAAVHALDTSRLIPRLAAEGRFYQEDIVANRKVPEAYFDLVYSCMVIEHVQDGVAFIAAMGRLARPAGRILVQSFNHRGVLTSFYNDPTHVRPYPPVALARAARLAGLDVRAAHNERSWPILLLAPAYWIYRVLTRRETVIPFFWEHLLAVQSIMIAQKRLR